MSWQSRHLFPSSNTAVESSRPSNMASITHSSSSLLPLLTPPPHQKLHPLLSPRRLPSKVRSFSAAVAPPNPITIDNSSLILTEATSDEELLAATCLRVRSFYHLKSDSFSPEDYKKYLVEREFKGLKDRVAGNRKGFRRVSCINASLPLSHVSSLSEDLCTACKFLHTGEQQVVVGTLDLNQCVKLPDEIAGMKPKGIGSDFARAYLSNVCVAKELHKKGLGYVLISKAKSIADQWGISDLYVHVAVDNEPAKKLYYKSGFAHESDETASEASFLKRPRRHLLWLGLRHQYL